MIIRGNANGAEIELSDPEHSQGELEYYRASITENNFEASLRVYAFDPKNEGLPKFFTELARDWKGWDGIRHWASLEGEFEIHCTHDGLGHVETEAILRSSPYTYGWTGQIRFEISARALDEISIELDKFFYRN